MILDKQCCLYYKERARTLLPFLLDLPADPVFDGRMHQLILPIQFLFIRKHNLCHGGPVKLSVRGEYTLPEMRPNLLKALHTRLHQKVAHLVGFHHPYA